MRQAEAEAEAAKAAGDRDPGDRAGWPAFTYQVTEPPTQREQFVGPSRLHCQLPQTMPF